MGRLAFGPRSVAALLLLIGLWLTSASTPIPARERQPHAGYRVIAADFHVHSFPGDGVLAPWDLAREARRRHLDAIALTNHNSTHSWRLAQWLSLTGGPDDALLIPGAELTSIGYHLATVGITEPVAWRQSAAAAAAAVHARGGASIAAHPGPAPWRFLDDAALAVLDGVEVDHPSRLVWRESRRQHEAFYARARRVRPSIAAIGSTDFHHFAPVGLDRTYLLVTGLTTAAVVDAIRAGRTVACDGEGTAQGQPELVAMVEADCRLDATLAPDGETAADRIGTWLIWLGVVALVLLGPAERLA
jgi:predicted metal-dependent phosphoesterase TrpH